MLCVQDLRRINAVIQQASLLDETNENDDITMETIYVQDEMEEYEDDDSSMGDHEAHIVVDANTYAMQPSDA